MSSRYDWPDHEIEDEAPKRASFWGLLALCVAGLLGVLMVASPDGNGKCKDIMNKDARLACFDAATHTQPAKGAAIPNF